MEHVLNVSGMTCGHCEMAVKRAILGLDPQAQIAIDRAHDQVQIESTREAPALIAAIAAEGYTVQARPAA